MNWGLWFRVALYKNTLDLCMTLKKQLENSTYHESASLSDLKAYNTIWWPTGTAISLYTLISPLTYAVYLWSVHCQCTLMQKWGRIVTIFTFGIRVRKTTYFSGTRDHHTPPVTPGYHPSPTTRPVVSLHRTLRGFLSWDQPKHYRIVCGNRIQSLEPRSVVGKVMFSVMSVSPCRDPHPRVPRTWTRDPTVQGPPSASALSLSHSRHVQIISLWSTDRWQVGDSYLTAILSCWK